MNFEPLERIADAVLYEGYILYPYRPSSLKNRQRWNFGTLYPRSFAERQSPPEPFSLQAEVLVAGSPESFVTGRIRFLHLLPGEAGDSQEWAEGATRSATLDQVRLGNLTAASTSSFDFQPSPEEKQHRLPARPITGKLTLQSRLLQEGLWRLTASFSNETLLPDAALLHRNNVQSLACISAHLLLGVEGGTFLSLLDPEPPYREYAASCANQSVFPVLAGDAGDRSSMLCSPIILYDYPQIAPESAGDFFDGTEMDEMLALRVLTLTSEEKAEISRADPHAAAILARTAAMPNEYLLKLHGAVRGMRPVSQEFAPPPAAATANTAGKMEDGTEPWNVPWNPFEEQPPLQSVRVSGADVRCGDRVRLWPGKRSDILDIAMNGKIAIVEAIEQDLEDKVQFAVVLEDDPGRDLGLLRQAGHRFFFTPEEIEPLSLEVP